MYSICLHCHRSLGSNEAVEHFPIGGRLATGALTVGAPVVGIGALLLGLSLIGSGVDARGTRGERVVICGTRVGGQDGKLLGQPLSLEAPHGRTIGETFRAQVELEKLVRQTWWP